ncbi:MAG: DNA polymerase domain-containing protein [archaeon]
MIGFIVHPTYKTAGRKAFVHLYGRLESGESFLAINEFKPYFFIRSKDLQKALGVQSFIHQPCDLKDFKEEPVAKIVLDVPSEVKQLRDRLADNGIHSYEADIRFEYRFMIDHLLQGGIDITGESRKGKSSDGEFVDLVFEEPKLSPADYFPKNLRTLSIDIETDIKGKHLYAISMVCDDYKKVLIISDKKLKNSLSFQSEEELLAKFREIIYELDPDIITGWNVIGFDLRFIESKFKQHKIPFKLGRADEACRLRIAESFFMESKADIIGRAVLDGIQVLKNNFVALDDYKLDTAAKEFLNDSKLLEEDNKGAVIDGLFKDNPQLLADYNLKDSELVLGILDKSKALNLTIQRSLLTGLPLDRIRASIASLDSLYLKELRKKGYVAATVGFEQNDGEGKGGFVKTSKPGIYDFVIVCDFKSMYSSIIQTFNIDPLSYLPDCDEKNKDKIDKDKIVKAINGACFRNTEGILPMIIGRLWKQRDKAKKEKNELARFAIKTLMNSFWGVLANPTCRFYNREMANAITLTGQHLIKLTASKIEEKGYEVIYGDSVGKDAEIIIKDLNGKITFRKISELFEKTDQSSLGKEYDFREDIQTLTIDDKGRCVFKPVKYVMRHKTDKKMIRVHLTNNWHVDVTEDHSLIGYQSVGFNNTNERKDPLKRMIELKPAEIKKRANSIVILKNIPGVIAKTRDYPKEVYEFMGYFIGDGSFQRNKSHQKYDKDYYLRLSLGVDSDEVFDKLISPLIRLGYIKNYWWSHTRKGDLTINGLKLIGIFSKDFRSVAGKKIIPDWLFEEKEEHVCAFLRGLFSADGCVMMRNNAPIIKLTSIYDDYIGKIRKLLYRVGVSHSVFKENSINKFKDKKKSRVFSSGSQSKNIILKNRECFVQKIGFLLDRKNRLGSIKTNPMQKKLIKNYDFELSSVLKTEEIIYDDYVYDIEVEDTHRFFANNVLVHNTDSIFVRLDVADAKEAFRIGKKMAEEINCFLEEHMKEEYHRRNYLELEFEKVYKRFIMPKVRGSDVGSKKRYAGLLIDEEGKEKMHFVGLEFVRRDWTELAKSFQAELLKRIFNKEEVAGYIKKLVDDVMTGKKDDLLVYRKAIRKEVADYTKTTPPHVKAARLLGDDLKSTLIEYVMTVEGPEPIQKLKHKIDYDHYIEKQIKPIADAILGFYNESFDDILKGSSQKTLFGY